MVSQKIALIIERNGRWLAVLAVVILLGAWRSLIAGVDYSLDRQPLERSVLLNSLIIPIYAFGMICIALRFRQAWAVIRGAWPLYVMPLLAILSTVWSVDPAATIDKASILMMVYLVCAGIVAMFGATNTYRIFAFSGAVILAGSLVMVAAFPQYGIHQQTDFAQAVHAGSWRGVFSHRTGLGQFCALYLVFILSGSYSFEKKWARWGVVACSILLILMSRSTGAMLTAVIGSLALVLARRFVRGGLMVQALSTLAILVGAVGVSMVKALVLENMTAIGKDATLTGRTEIWDKLMSGTYDNEIIGQGYIAGFRHVFALRFDPDYPLPNSQNAFLDLYIAFGGVGVIVVIAAFIALYVMAFMAANAMRGAGSQRSEYAYNQLALVIALIVALIQFSVVESFYVEGNSFVTPILGLLIPAAFLAAKRSKPVRLLPEFRHLIDSAASSGPPAIPKPLSVGS